MNIETSESQPEKEGGFNFQDNIDYFPEVEQEKAKFYAGINDRFNISKSHGSDNNYVTYRTFERFANNLMAEKGDAYARDCWLFHLLAGSSMSRQKWETMKMDTPTNDYEKFVEKIFDPLLTEQGF